MKTTEEKIFLGILLGGIGIVLSIMFKPFLSSIVVAFLLASSNAILYNFLHTKFKNRYIIAIVMTILLGLTFIVPFLYFINYIGTLITAITDDNIELAQKAIFQKIDYIDTNIFHIKKYISDNMLDINNIKYFKDGAKSLLQLGFQIGHYSFSFISNILMILMFYFIFISNGFLIYKYIIDLLPISKRNSNYIFNEILGVTGVVFYSSVIAAVVEGFLFGFFVSFVDLDGLVFGIVYAFASLIPIVGGMLVWVPLLIYGLVTGDHLQDAIVVAIYSIVVISIFADTFVKFMIIKYINKINYINTNINKLLILFSIIAGVSSFGFWGMIIGPASIVLFITILKIINTFQMNNKEHIAFKDTSNKLE